MIIHEQLEICSFLKNLEKMSPLLHFWGLGCPKPDMITPLHATLQLVANKDQIQMGPTELGKVF